MRNIIFLLFISSMSMHIQAQSLTIQERLGHSKETKLLIIHADDMGVAHAENSATFKAMQTGTVNSGSIMVPCPWFTEVVSYVKENPNADLGLHLTLTSEWKHYKWGPVTSSGIVPGLVNHNGFLYSSVDSVVMFAKPSEVEEEMRNQVKKAIKMGIDPTHLDAHMGGAFSTPAFLKAYIKVGKEFNIPVMLSRQLEALLQLKLDSLIDPSMALIDNIITAMPPDFKSTMRNYYTSVLNGLKPGLNCLLIHTAYDNDEMKAITIDHPEWGAAWRQEDFDFFTSATCKELLKKNNIVLVTWREIRDKLYRPAK
ncbi:MAG TPA: polysaccharide deacetylase family protein [Chitinophagaceae bacterium]|nr:polysaccharide deacetylase family protein [Chitinophagaceae bacterium]